MADARSEVRRGGNSAIAQWSTGFDRQAEHTRGTKMRLRIASLAVAACAAVALALPLGAAQAATSPHAAQAAISPHVTFKAPPGARIIATKKLQSASSAASTCPYTFDGDTGWFICGDRVATIQFTFGNYEAFGIGADYSVWTAWGAMPRGLGV